MTTSYVGDRLQQLAQAWLVATLTDSALGVGLISAAGSIGQFLLPIGGVLVPSGTTMLGTGLYWLFPMWLSRRG